MNRNNVIGLLLIGAIFVIWSIWLTPSKEEQARQQFVRDSIAREYQIKRAIVDSINMLNTDKVDQLSDKTKNQPEKSVNLAEDHSNIDRLKYGVFANSASGEEKIITVETNILKLQFTNKGGRILSAELKDYQTFDGQTLILFNSDTTRFNLSFFVGNYLVNTQDLYFQIESNHTSIPESGHVNLSKDETFTLALRLYVDIDGVDYQYNPNKYVEYLYTINGNKYMFDYDIHFVGMQDVISQTADYLNLEWELDIRKQEKTVDRWNGPTIYYKYLNDDVDNLSENKDDEENLKSRVKWISYKQHFFSTSLIAKEYFVNADIKTNTNSKNTNDRYLKSMHSIIGLPYTYGIEQSIPMAFYFGPNKFSILRKHKLGLEHQIPLGWGFFLLSWINIYAVIPVFNFLGSFGWNYGIIIFILTILLKIVLFPIAYKTYKSTAKMKVLKPEIEELSKKFPKKEDAMKKQQAVMALYKRAGVNPMAGCVPMLLQMPILFAMFRFFPSSIELRQQPFLWATDLSSYDSIWTFPSGFSIPFYGDHISLFTLLMTFSTIIYTKLNNQMMSSSQQMPGMKTMMYLMPIMFLGIFNNYASGLSYYYLLANLITFGQMFLIRRTIDEKKILTQIELNKKRPIKKSKFQQRLEEAQKRRGIYPKR